MKAPWPFHVQFDGPAALRSDLNYLGQGRNHFCYTMQGPNPLALKLIWADTHRELLAEYQDMPKLAARVCWQGNVVVKWANSPERGLSTMCGLVCGSATTKKPQGNSCGNCLLPVRFHSASVDRHA